MILAIVDPGVGTHRRAVAIAVGPARVVLVGPDNGLLLPAALRLGPITAAVELEPTHLEWGATFAGRDLFAPAAARIAMGADLYEVGAAIDPQTLQGEAVAIPECRPDGSLRAEVLWIDRFGNVQLNVTPSDAKRLGPVIDVRTYTQTRPARVVNAYADLQGGELGFVLDSYGLLSISLYAVSAADLTGLRPGDPVWLSGRA